MSQIPDSSLEADLRQLLVQAQILVGDGQKTVGMSNFVTVRVKSSVINGVTGSKDTVPLESQLAKRLQDLSVTENTLPTLPHDPTPSELQWRFVLESLSIVTSIHNTIVAMERTGCTFEFLPVQCSPPSRLTLFLMLLLILQSIQSSPIFHP